VAGDLMLKIGTVDLAEIAGSVKHETFWNNGPGKLTFEYPAAKAGRYANGTEAVFTYNSASIFYGWLMETSQDSKKYKCTCYDQLRYFKGSNSIMRPVTTLTDWVNTVALDCGDRIRLGTIESTEVKLGKYLFDNKTRLDMVYQSIEDNLIANGYWYVFRDAFGALELRNVYNLRLPLIIGDGSLAKDFDYTVSIDSDTFNFVKVAKDDSDKGVRNVYISKDDSTIKKWGKLMIYDKVSAGLNDSQLADRSRRLLAIKNRETQELSVECMGDVRANAGSSVRVVIKSAGLDKWAVIDHATHEYTKTQHTMKLDLKFTE